MNIKYYKFEVTQSFKNLVSKYGIEGISDINIGGRM